MILNSSKRTLLARNLANRWQGISCALALVVATVGCADSPDSLPIERVGVEGLVTLDGQPLKAGAIVFHGLDSKDGSVITAHAFIEDGKYQIDAAVGPAVGMSRVEFRPKPLPREQYEGSLDEAAKSRNRRASSPTAVEIPDRYGQQSELRVELLRGKRNHHNFQLDSRS